VVWAAAEQVQAERAKTLQVAYAGNPERFCRKPTPPQLPHAAWINEPSKEIENSKPDQYFETGDGSHSCGQISSLPVWLSHG
jgi:hypothetical protein